MYERMLNKQASPTIEEMTKFCGENSERFSLLNEWLASAFNTEQKIVFPYGNNYGWGVAHKKKNKLNKVSWKYRIRCKRRECCCRSVKHYRKIGFNCHLKIRNM